MIDFRHFCRAITFFMAMTAAACANTQTIRVGSKSFSESVILAEMAAHLARDAGFRAEHVAGLGGTRVLWEALLAGQIDVYAEYTGTMSEEIFAGDNIRGLTVLREKLAELGLEMTKPIGFNNTYAIGMKESLAQKRGIKTISDLRMHPELSLRFSNEFMKRADGWEALATTYQLPQTDVRGLEHALAYEALDNGVIHVTDLYATDAKIQMLALRKLEDDLAHFPAYHAVFVFRASLNESAKPLVENLVALENSIDDATMTRLNAHVEIDGRSEAKVAADFLEQSIGIKSVVKERSTVNTILTYTLEHLQMVVVSLTAAVLLAVPLGIFAAHRQSLARPILGAVGIIQTIPSIALLVLLIRPVSWFTNDLGYPQAVVALFLYSLLPIVSNTYTGLKTIAPSLRESALALGLPRGTRLLRIELPLASQTILAGIKTAAVINVGFATLGGFIGAGGYGEPIFAGIRLNDYTVILQGAVPAAVLALLVQGLFECLERVVVPSGLRRRSTP